MNANAAYQVPMQQRRRRICAGDIRREVRSAVRKTHSLLPPGLICHRVAPDRSLFLAGLRP